MGIPQGHSLNHWNYFLTLESDISALSRYVEPCEENYATYSQELARILLATSSEVDVLLKGMCEQLVPGTNAESIGAYEQVIRDNLPNIFEFQVHIPRWGLSLTPWVDWNTTNPPLWWTACNKVKHHRDTEYQRANLKHTLNSVAALFITNLFYHQREAEHGELIPMQKLFRADDAYNNGINFDGFEYGITYQLCP